VTDVSAQTRGSGRTGRKGDRRGNPVSRFFRSLSLFVSQILDELRKVVRPTR
jgi:preprotein translocase subunit SecE